MLFTKHIYESNIDANRLSITMVMKKTRTRCFTTFSNDEVKLPFQNPSLLAIIIS